MTSSSLQKKKSKPIVRLPKSYRPAILFKSRAARNFLYLLGVMVAAVLNGHFGWPRGIQEAIMFTMARLSWYTTPPFHPSRKSLSFFADY